MKSFLKKYSPGFSVHNSPLNSVKIMQLPKINTDKEQRNYNNPIYGQHGEYSLSGHVRVPYFAALLDLKRVTKELKTHEEVTPSLDNNYNLVELFQRNIDPERVRKEIVEGYLKNPAKLKFFNSITVVLLPKDHGGHIQREFEDYEGNDPQIPYMHDDSFDTWFSGNDTQTNRVVYGGVQFISTNAAAISRLRWDLNTVDAVAVDGQHRLKALKLWMSGNNYELAETARSTRVSVIFLLLHSRAGFTTAPGTSASIKSIAREIFTDLNKNAREVDLATQIILDDRSLASCCVRSLITESTCTDHETLLPLSLLRWQDANNRFDQRYFLNSLVNLHLIIEDLLGLAPPLKEAMDKNKAQKFIKDATQRLGILNPQTGRKEILCDGMDLQTYYEQKFLDSETGDPTTPLTGIPPQFLPAAVEGFKLHFSGWLLRLLREFRPYSQLLAYARQHNLIEGQFARYLAQPKDHRAQLSNELSAEHGDQWEDLLIYSHERYIEYNFKGFRELGKGEQWAFKTIFQKAFLRLAKSLFLEIPEDQRERYGSLDDFLAFMNRLHDSDFLRVKTPLPGQSFDYWTFVAVNFGSGRIKVASTSERKIEALLALIYYSLRHIKMSGKTLVKKASSELETDVKELIKFWETKQSSNTWMSSKEHYDALHGEFFRQAEIIVSIPDPALVDDKKRREIARTRIAALLGGALNCFFAEEDEGI
jgi:hypothetical protein